MPSTTGPTGPQEWIIFAAITIVTLAACLALIRWLAPSLLGLPTDLRLVRVAKEAPAFFETVFNPADYGERKLLLNDPISVVRGKPLLEDVRNFGPNDLLGFRNFSVPNKADVVAIGDSQTYGNNATLPATWPQVFSRSFADAEPSVYAMATAGWGAVQYIYMVTKATVLKPSLIIVAFYTGNDPMESFNVAYSDERWSQLRPDPELDASDAPSVPWPVKAEDVWTARLSSGREAGFTPKLRLVSNQNTPVTRAGYGVMANAAREIARLLSRSGISLVFTIIPTKELVYLPLLARDGVQTPDVYRRLVKAEQANVATLEAAIEAIPNARYVPVISALQAAVMQDPGIYPANQDGHPTPSGYRVIGEALAMGATFPE